MASPLWPYPRSLEHSPSPQSYEGISIHGMPCLHCKEAPCMASVRYTDVQVHPAECLDVTSMTLEEFQILVPPFEAAFHAPMAA